MGTEEFTADKKQAGFTLVELAVVMIIIGLLIGGVLKGQELITNAQVTSAVSQMKGFDAAVTTFRDSYAAVPGDMRTATTRLPNCGAGSVCEDGDGNNRIDSVAAGVAPGDATQENVQTWIHLSAADLISGVDNSGSLTFGESLPEASIGGGYFIGFYDTSAALPGTGLSPRAGHYLALTGDPTEDVGANPTSAVIRSSQAARIDRKMDDGAPNTGTVLAADTGGATKCRLGTNATSLYDEQNDPLDCALYVRVQQ